MFVSWKKHREYFVHRLPYLNVGNQVALTVVLDFVTLALLAIGFYSQTATVIAIDNYWGTNYDLTGDVRQASSLPIQ